MWEVNEDDFKAIVNWGLEDDDFKAIKDFSEKK